MLNLFQYFFPKRPSFVDEILTGADQARAKELYDARCGKHGFVISVDPRDLAWGEDVGWVYEDEERTAEEEQYEYPRVLQFYDKPWRVKNDDWMLAYDMEDEMSSFVWDETTKEVVQVSAGFGMEERTVVASSLAVFLDQLENAEDS